MVEEGRENIKYRWYTAEQELLESRTVDCHGGLPGKAELQHHSPNNTSTNTNGIFYSILQLNILYYMKKSI